MSAVVNALRSVAWRVWESVVRASLWIWGVGGAVSGRVCGEGGGGMEEDVREQLGARAQPADGLAHDAVDLGLRLAPHLAELEGAPAEDLVVGLLEVA